MPRYMTRRGFDAINAEIDHLWHTERPEMVKQVTAAAELGDRSENGAYIYGKKKLRQIDSRMRYLRRKIDGRTIVDCSCMKHFEDVRFGAIVTIEDEEGETKTYRLVDKDESEPGKGRISIQSPVGRALMGKRVGDFVEVRLPRGLIEFEITALRYGGGEP